MKIAICQSHIRYLDFDYNIKYAKNAIYAAANKKAECIFFPEMSFTGFSMNTLLTSAYAEASLDAVKNFSAENNITIGFGWTEMCEDYLARNHYSLISPCGGIIIDYIKIHPFSYAGENRYFKGGTSLPIADIRDMRIQCTICYDLRFPELFRINAENIHAVIVPANWPAKRLQHWSTLLKARAIENQIYIIGVNCIGVQNGLLYSGGSAIISPDGAIISDCGINDGVYYADICPENVTKIRKDFPVLKDIRCELYKSL